MAATHKDVEIQLTEDGGYVLKSGDLVSEEAGLGEPADLTLADGTLLIAYVDETEEGEIMTPLKAFVYTAVPIPGVRIVDLDGALDGDTEQGEETPDSDPESDEGENTDV